MITLITTGRDDDYGHGFLDRLYLSISNNLETISKLDIEYEYIICEWNPERDYLINNEKFKPLFEKYNIREVIISKSVVQKELLNERIFYEYFAKNCGVRNSKYDNIIILNSDIIIPKESFDVIVENVKNGLSKDKFYRLEFREQINNDLTFITSESVHYPSNPDAVICGYCSGDVLLINKDTFITKGMGYDETNPEHRTVSQRAMDGEFLWNLYYRGCTIELMPFPYKHINHGRPHAYDNNYNDKGYVNKSDWGFINYEHNIISDKLTVIK